MVKNPRLTSGAAEKMLLSAGYTLIRCKGSHKIYQSGTKRFVLPFHTGKILHPKIVKLLLELLNG